MTIIRFAAHSQSPTLWAGTNSGQVLIFLIDLPEGDKRKSDGAKIVLGKEIQLKHKAPVIAIEVLDNNGVPVNESKGEAVPHKVLIVSEEQFKTFLLPTLKPCGKYKLTAHEGSRIRRVGFTSFVAKSDKQYSENCLTCLTNQGDLAIHSLPDLRRQVQTNCTKKEDVIAISTLVFTPKGEAFYMCSSSELQRVSLAAAHFLAPSGTVEIDPEARAEEEDVSNEVNKENKKNEMEAQIKEPKSPDSVTSPTDAHNETIRSEISADITLDSVRDHTL